MSSSTVLPFSDLDLFSQDETLFGHHTFADEGRVFELLDEIRKHVQWHGTSIAHGARHGMIVQVVVTYQGDGCQALSFVDNHGRELLAVNAGDAPGDLNVVTRLIEEVGVPPYIVERATGEGTFVFRASDTWGFVKL